MGCIEEVINIPELLKRFDRVVSNQALSQVMSEIVLQSRMEFNLEEIEAEEPISNIDDIEEETETAQDVV